MDLRDSDTYLAMLEDRADEARRMILRLGQKQWGPPAEDVRARLQAITDIERLEQLGEALLDAASWSDLFGAD